MNDGQLLDTILHDFTGAISGSWGPSLSSYLLPLLMALVVLQFGMIAIEAAIARDIPLLLIHVLFGIIRVGVVLAIFQHATEWGNDIILTFQQAGETVSGLAVGGIGPSEVFNHGANIANSVMTASASGGFLNEALSKIEFFIVGVAVGACWLVASLLYLGALLDAALLVYAGPLIICVTPLSWTFDLLVTWGRAVLGIAFKVALILMVLGIGLQLVTGWETSAAASATSFTTDLGNLLIPLVESTIFAFCVWKVPNQLSGMAGGHAFLGFGEAVTSMAASAVGGSLKAASGGSGAGSDGSTGGGSTSQGWASQGAQALASQAKALMQKVQAKLTA